MLKVAILGFWHVHATGYAEMIRDHPGTELVGVWDPDPVRGVEASERWGVPSSGAWTRRWRATPTRWSSRRRRSSTPTSWCAP